MSRRRSSVERKIEPDVKYNSLLVTKFVNSLMLDGKKDKVRNIFYKALDKISEIKQGEDPFKIFNNAVKNVTPLMEVKSRRVGGATYQVPMEVRKKRATSLAFRWLVKYSNDRNGKSMVDKLAKELIDASEGLGSSFKKKEDVHRMAEANKAFAHFRY
jgi:small subunit ribosomal protein S7